MSWIAPLSEFEIRQLLSAFSSTCRARSGSVPLGTCKRARTSNPTKRVVRSMRSKVPVTSHSSDVQAKPEARATARKVRIKQSPIGDEKCFGRPSVTGRVERNWRRRPQGRHSVGFQLDVTCSRAVRRDRVVVWTRLHVGLTFAFCWRDARAPGKVTDGPPESRHSTFRRSGDRRNHVSPRASFVHPCKGSSYGRHARRLEGIAPGSLRRGDRASDGRAQDARLGVLTTIDVKQTLKAKLDRDFRKYMILGACNPPLADRALHAELEVGLLLPCNVIVYETSPSSSVVAAMAPLAALGVVGDNVTLAQVARDADRRLRQALASLESPVTAEIGSSSGRG